MTSQTHNRLRGFFEAFQKGIDILLSLQQNNAPSKAVPLTAQEKFQSSAGMWFFGAVFTFTASVRLFESGYYTESVVLNRGLTELLIQIRYFSIFPDEMLKLPSLANNRKRQIPIRSMAEAIAPGFYDVWYRFSSEFAHVGLGANIFKFTRDEVTGIALGDAGVVYKENWCGACLNEVTMLLLGFIRAYGIAFPNASTSVPASIQSECAQIEDLLDKMMVAHMELKGGPNEWHNLSRPLWKPQC